jgi:hypothetical protein
MKAFSINFQKPVIEEQTQLKPTTHMGDKTCFFTITNKNKTSYFHAHTKTYYRKLSMPYYYEKLSSLTSTVIKTKSTFKAKELLLLFN